MAESGEVIQIDKCRPLMTDLTVEVMVRVINFAAGDVRLMMEVRANTSALHTKTHRHGGSVRTDECRAFCSLKRFVKRSASAPRWPCKYCMPLANSWRARSASQHPVHLDENHLLASEAQ